jgi:hypothetical protein
VFQRNFVRTAVLAAGLVLAAIGTASAKSICLQDSTGDSYIFTKVKLPKKPGQTTSFSGVQYLIGGAFNISVTTSMYADGSIQASALMQSPFTIGLSNLLAWETDSTLTGTVYYDNDGDYLKDDGSFMLTAIDCASVVVP